MTIGGKSSRNCSRLWPRCCWSGNYGTINHQTWYNVGLMAIANVTADAELARKVVTMTGGYRDQLARAIGPDGMWREGTMAYHGTLCKRWKSWSMRKKLGLPLAEAPCFATDV